MRFTESLAEQFSRTLPGFTDALMRVSTELSGRPGVVHIEGAASAETVHPHGSVIGVHISITNVSADEAFDRLIGRPLERLAPDPPPIVVIDALDEALTYRTHRTIAELVLDRTAGLPLRFVITSRHDARVLAARDSIEGAASLDLVADAPNADADLVEYALHRLEHLVEDEAEREVLARQLAAHGAGNYLYVYHLTEELAVGRRDMTEIADFAVLPRGLEDLYRQFLRREIRPIGNAAAEDRWRKEFRPVLSLLISAQEDGFTAAQLAEILDSTEQSVMDVVQVLGQYLLGETRGPWTLYHRSFADFLLQGTDAHLDVAEGHQRIAEYAFGRWADAWETCDDAYYLRHLPDHLMTVLECHSLTHAQTRTFRDRLYALATSEEYLAAQQGAAPGREPHMATIALALESSVTNRQYKRVTRLALSLVRTQLAAEANTPVQIALAWGIEAGVAKARTYPEDVSLLWHLLIMASLGFQKRSEALSVADIIHRSGFGTIDSRWSPAAAALLAPFVPVLGTERLRVMLQIADDYMLGYLAVFLLEGIAPEFSIVPALWIEEDLLRARAITEILSRMALSGENIEALSQLGDWVMEDYAQRQRRRDRTLGLDTETNDFKSYLLVPDVPDSVLVAEAARDSFQQARQELTAEGIYSFRTSASAVLLGMIVDAIMHGGPSLEQARDTGEKALEQQPGNVWSILHYTSYLQSLGDPRAPALLDRIVELSHSDGDEDYMWDMYKGHVDAFHGRCDVGLRLAVIRALCAAGRPAKARAEAEQLRTDNPAEFVRALSYVHNTETDVDQARKVLMSAQQVAAANPGNVETQTMLVLVDGDFQRLLDTVADWLARASDSSSQSGCTARAVLAWAAYLRGDQDRAASLGRKTCEQFCEIPQERRSDRTRDRLVRLLLRAGLPDVAAIILETPTTHWGSGTLLALDDVQHELALSGELKELRMLRQALGQTAEPTDGDSLDSQLLTMRFFRADGDLTALARVQATARTILRSSIERMEEEVREDGRQYYSSDNDEERAAKLALLAADLGEPDIAKTAVALMNTWAYKAEMSSESWDAFRGHFPRAGELRRDSDNKYSRLSHVAAHLAEAYYRAGDPIEAAASFNQAREYAGIVTTAQSRSLAFTMLAETAARCCWYEELKALWPEVMRIRGSELGSIAEILAVTLRRGGVHTSDARDALDTIMLSKSLADFDYADLLSLLAVLSPDSTIEAQLLTAFSEE